MSKNTTKPDRCNDEPSDFEVLQYLLAEANRSEKLPIAAKCEYEKLVARVSEDGLAFEIPNEEVSGAMEGRLQMLNREGFIISEFRNSPLHGYHFSINLKSSWFENLKSNSKLMQRHPIKPRSPENNDVFSNFNFFVKGNSVTQSLRRYMASTIAEEINQEIDLSEKHYGPFHSLHEGLAVLREEYLELEEAIFWGVRETGDTKCVRKEAIQVASVAMRIAMMVSPVPHDIPWEEEA